MRREGMIMDVSVLGKVKRESQAEMIGAVLRETYNRLKRCEVAMRENEDYVGSRVMDVERQGRRKRGLPMLRWRDCVKKRFRNECKGANES